MGWWWCAAVYVFCRKERREEGKFCFGEGQKIFLSVFVYVVMDFCVCFFD